MTGVATALAGDDEMRARIKRHRRERPAGFDTVEASLALAAALREHAASERLPIVDCLTRWLTNWLMPASGMADASAWHAEHESLTSVLRSVPSPAVFVSNQVGWGMVPLSRGVREYVDELGRLNQAVTRCCSKLTPMVGDQAWAREAASGTHVE